MKSYKESQGKLMCPFHYKAALTKTMQGQMRDCTKVYGNGGRSRPPDNGGRGGGRPDPKIRGAQCPKNFFWPFEPQFGLKIWEARAPFLDPPLGNY